MDVAKKTAAIWGAPASGPRRPRLAALITIAALVALCCSVGRAVPAAASGGSWSAATAAPPSSDAVLTPTPQATSCPAAGDCVTVGTYLTGAGSTLGLLLTQSSGSWSAAEAPYPAGAAPSPALSFGAVECTAVGACMAVGTYKDSLSNTQGLLLGDTSGSWSASEAPLPSGAATTGQVVALTSVVCLSSSSCLAVGTYKDSSGNTQGLLEADSSGSWSASEAPLPSGAATTGQTVSLSTATCLSATSCVAVGTYKDGSGNTQGLLLTATAGSWSAAKAPLPSGAASNPLVGIVSLYCASTTSCIAFGSYDDTSSNAWFLLLTDTAGSWSEAKGPVPSGGSEIITAGSLSCPSSSSCVAVGSYLASSYVYGVLLTDSSGTWSAAEAPEPSNATTTADPFVEVDQIDCTSSSSCVAVGTYDDTNNYEQGLLLTDSSGTWSAAEAPLPSGATSANPFVSPTSLACASSSSCVAVGTYTDSSANTEGALLTDSSGSWSASEATLPSGASPSPMAVPDSVSCASFASCVAVGSYKDSSAHTQGLLLTDSSGTWSAAEAPLPSGAASNPAVTLSTVSCPSATSCVAAGSYTAGRSTEGVLLTDSSGTWSAAVASLPSGAYSRPAVALDSIACASSSSCVAVGTYLDGSSHTQGLVLSDTSGSWSATEAPLPSGTATNPTAALDSIACASSSSCVAVGTYLDGSSHTQGLVLSDTSGSWSASEAPLPSGTATNPTAALDSIACASSSSCVAVGTYLDGSSHTQGLVLSDTSGSWSASEAPLPSGTATNPTVALDSIACASSSSCVASGSYQDGSSDAQGLLLNDSAGSWSATEAPLPSGTATNPTVALDSIACASSSSCVASGSYQDGSSDAQGLLLNDSAGSWSATEAPTLSGVASNPGAVGTATACATGAACVSVGHEMDLNGGADALLETDTPSPGILAAPTIGWSTTLNGYDASIASAVTLVVANYASSGWDVTVEASGDPTAGTSQLAGPTINGSAASASAATAPAQSCLSTCAAASDNTVTYPLTVPVGTAADVYNAAAGSGIGPIVLVTIWWVAVPADSPASSSGYLASVSLTLSSGP